MANNWPLISALMGGTSAMRAAGKDFLPQWPNEPDPSYKARVATATLFPAFSRTVEVLGSKPFSKPLTYGDDVPPQIKEWCEDVDLQGRNLHTFADNVAADALARGIAGILVDYPTVTGATTVADEKKQGGRPYFVQICFENVLGWKSERIAGVETLTQLRLLEMAVEPDGEFHEQQIPQVRVLYRDRWETYREKKDSLSGEPKWVLEDQGTISIGVIPFIPVYGKRTAFMMGTPPLLELAHMNVEHWQSKSDQQTILHVARVPILFARMLGNAGIVVGASQAVESDNEKGDLKYVEHTGAAIDAGRLSILDLEDRMRQIGAELLVIKPGNTSITQTLADNEPGMCALQRIAQSVEDALDAALQMMAKWVGIPEAGHVQLFKDFGVHTLSEASLELLREMNVDGTLSDEQLFIEAQRRGLVSPDIKWEDEKKRIAQNVPKQGIPQGSDGPASKKKTPSRS
ncbi:MAG: DUF4055 domain-containing protein [Cupriavidus sp.]|nr:DUF4055 domain-containing protein [Cupriavidus sp.]MCA3194327.1 DUF4055 domain-containing protein [Cupriavidus sp.]MCA3200435.1 DUF4055 domain-containing protein [Cupriavidus sp.]QWE95945.1 DUF4055 domain-containing protein [Cupriavidus sp. EM10]